MKHSEDQGITGHTADRDEEIAASVGHCATQNGDVRSWATERDIHLQEKFEFWCKVEKVEFNSRNVLCIHGIQKVN